MLKNRYELDKVIEIFQKKNLKPTLQRINIYLYMKSSNEHPTVDTIYKNIKILMPTISLATVYKTINTFVEYKIVKMLNLCEDNFRYDIRIDSHAHMKCKICNKIEDLNLNKNINDIFPINEYGNIEEFDLFLYGKCEDCSKKYI